MLTRIGRITTLIKSITKLKCINQKYSLSSVLLLEKKCVKQILTNENEKVLALTCIRLTLYNKYAL